MENWKSTQDFTQGVEKLRKAKDCIDSAKIDLLKARELRLIELRTQKEKLNNLLSSLKHQKEETKKEFQLECGKIGHNYKVIKKKYLGMGERRTFLGCESIYHYTEQCEICGFIQSYLKTPTKKIELNKQHHALIEKYNSKISDIDSEINKVISELEKLCHDFVEICSVFGHDVGRLESKLRDGKVKCLCCEQEFSDNDFVSFRRELSKFINYPTCFYTFLNK